MIKSELRVPSLTHAKAAGICDTALRAMGLDAEKALDYRDGYDFLVGGQVRVAVRMGQVPLLPGAAECVAQGIFSSLQPANLRLKRGVSNEAQALKHPAYPLLFDPQTSGGLLAAVPAERAEACLAALRAAGYEEAAAIGEIGEALEEGVCAPALIECVP